MNSSRWITLAIAAAFLRLAFHFPSHAAESAPPTSASDLASRLSALYQDGSSYVRVRMETQGAAKETLQLQIKQRRTKTATEVVYQVLYPKERKGESILLRQVGNRSASGSVFVPPNTLRAIDNMKDALLGSDLSYADAVENFFAWDQQALGATEVVDGVSCQILESKPGKGGSSIYGSVRSWIDLRRMVPLRVEKYSSSGQLLRRIDTTRVVTDAGHPIPADLTVRGSRPDSSTLLDGSRIKHDVSYTDADFKPEGLKDIAAPHGAPE
jgi:hypothetical protein